MKQGPDVATSLGCHTDITMQSQGSLGPQGAAQGRASLHPAHLIPNTDNLPWIIESWLCTAELY